MKDKRIVVKSLIQIYYILYFFFYGHHFEIRSNRITGKYGALNYWCLAGVKMEELLQRIQRAMDTMGRNRTQPSEMDYKEEMVKY